MIRQRLSKRSNPASLPVRLLDTYENEASIFNHDLEGQEIEDETFKELIKLDNVVVSPHIAFYTNVAVENMVKISLDSAKEVIETGTSSTLVK